MANLDRLAWPAEIAFRSYGIDFGLRVSDPSVMEAFVATLPFGTKVTQKPRVEHIYSVVVRRKKYTRFGSPRLTHSLFSNAVEILKHDDEWEIVRAFESDIRKLVAEYARRRVFVHAGSVRWKGRAIIIPGSSYSGKTSFVRELISAGASYFSDEYAVLDGRGFVHPYLKPLSIRRPGEWAQTNYPAAEFGAREGRRPAPLGGIIVTRFKPGARWKPRVLSPGSAVLSLLAHTVPARQDPHRVLQYLTTAATHARTIKSDRGEASEITNAVLEYFSSDWD